MANRVGLRKKNMKTELENIAKIQAVFYRLSGFAKEIAPFFPNLPGTRGWKIEYSDDRCTFRLRLGESTLVYANIENDTYTIDIIIDHIRKEKTIRIVSHLYRTYALNFLKNSLDSISFDIQGGVTMCHNPTEATDELIRSLLEFKI